jgi:hypothetical protein
MWGNDDSDSNLRATSWSQFCQSRFRPKSLSSYFGQISTQNNTLIFPEYCGF